jgi:predicted nucleic-acid-binding protein
VRITADTNILLRVVLDDEPEQARQARALMERASLIAVPVPVFCELVWTMRRLYKRRPDEVADAVEAILQVASVVTDRPAVEAGLGVLRAGGDFADGTIAWQGAAIGGEVLATFARDGLRPFEANGLAAAEPAQLLSGN